MNARPLAQNREQFESNRNGHSGVRMIGAVTWCARLSQDYRVAVYAAQAGYTLVGYRTSVRAFEQKIVGSRLDASVE